MNLKEAFRYQNRLQAFMDQAQAILGSDSNITKTENTYLRKKVMPEAENETVLVVPDTEYHDRITDMARFLTRLLEEKEKLFYAIRTAKNSLPIDLDSEVALNASRQSVAQTFKHMADLRGYDQTISNGGTGYRFNAEGNQVSYRCDVRKVTTIHFDRNVIRKELNRLYQKSDEMSAQLDLCLVTSKVDYAPLFDVNASFAEAFESVMGAAGA